MLTAEGKIMYSKLAKTKVGIPPKKPILPQLPTLQDQQIDFFRKEIADLLENSKNVVEDCNNILSLCTTQDEYLRSDTKVAKMIHERLIGRYTRLLNYQSALG